MLPVEKAWGVSVSDTGRGETTVDRIPYEVIVSVLKVTPTTFVFIRVVPTVVVVVTLPAARHTAVVLTSKLVRLTCPLSCTNHRKCSITKKQRELNHNITIRKQ